MFRLLQSLSSIEPALGPTDLVAAARHAAAQLHGRGVIVLISDLLDPAADRVIRELAATRSGADRPPRPSPDELDPQLEGDLRLVDSETGDGIDITADLPTLDAYRQRLAAWKESFADLAARRRGELRRPRLRHPPQRADLRRAPPASGARLGRRERRQDAADHAAGPARPAVRARGDRDVPAPPAAAGDAGPVDAASWHRLVADVEANAPWQRLRRSLLFLLQLLLVIILVLLAARPFLERPARLARDIVLVVDTSASMAATDLQPNRLGAAKQAAIDALRELPTGGKVSVVEAGPDRPDRRRGLDRPGARSAWQSSRSSRRRHPATSATRSRWRRSWPRSRATPRSSSRPMPRSRACRRSRVDAPVRVLRVGTDGGSRNQAIVALAVEPLRRA